jgi:hypothetical protein
MQVRWGKSLSISLYEREKFFINLAKWKNPISPLEKGGLRGIF